MIRSCPAGQYFVEPVPISNTVLPTGTVYPTQFTNAEERLAPTDASAAAAIKAATQAHQARAVLGHATGLARASAEGRYRRVAADLLREGFGYDWRQVLAPLAVGGAARFLSERAYMSARLRGPRAVVAEQTAMRERLSCLLCWARALAAEVQHARDDREATAVKQATLELLNDAEKRLDASTSSWAKLQVADLKGRRAALEAMRPPERARPASSAPLATSPAPR